LLVVSDTSPIINLAAIGRLDVLERMYGSLLIPPSVYREIAVVGAGQPGAEEVQTLSWIATGHLSQAELASSLHLELDEGEAEAIALALQEGADLLLLDERRGRGVALQLGLRVLGTLGVLIDAKRRGYVNEVKPILDGLMTEAGFWVSPQLYARVMDIASE
jgi:predicted nucleic acid-binding protein